MFVSPSLRAFFLRFSSLLFLQFVFFVNVDNSFRRFSRFLLLPQFAISKVSFGNFQFPVSTGTDAALAVAVIGKCGRKSTLISFPQVSPREACQ